MTFSIVLPWPSRVLHPNARPHRAVLTKAKRAARRVGKVEAMIAILPPDRIAIRDAEALEVSVTFNPPDRRTRDDDGMIASMKAARDGIADAIGLDDGRWRVSYAVGAPVRGGRVTFELRPIPA